MRTSPFALAALIAAGCGDPDPGFEPLPEAILGEWAFVPDDLRDPVRTASIEADRLTIGGLSLRIGAGSPIDDDGYRVDDGVALWDAMGAEPMRCKGRLTVRDGELSMALTDGFGNDECAKGVFAGRWHDVRPIEELPERFRGTWGAKDWNGTHAVQYGGDDDGLQELRALGGRDDVVVVVAHSVVDSVPSEAPGVLVRKGEELWTSFQQPYSRSRQSKLVRWTVPSDVGPAQASSGGTQLSIDGNTVRLSGLGGKLRCEQKIRRVVAREAEADQYVPFGGGRLIRLEPGEPLADATECDARIDMLAPNRCKLPHASQRCRPGRREYDRPSCPTRVVVDDASGRFVLDASFEIDACFDPRGLIRLEG